MVFPYETSSLILLIVSKWYLVTSFHSDLRLYRLVLCICHPRLSHLFLPGSLNDVWRPQFRDQSCSFVPRSLSLLLVI